MTNKKLLHDDGNNALAQAQATALEHLQIDLPK